MTKLTYSQYKNSYTCNKKKTFTGHKIAPEDILKAIEFAYEMSYGEGHHRHHRTGGTACRKNGEIFCNTFQGKLAEIILHHLLAEKGIAVQDIDFSIHGEGIWDDCDIIADGKRLNVKSAAHFSNLLLLETQDWDAQGNYLPSSDKDHQVTYDFFVMVRFNPDIKGLFSSKRIFYSDSHIDLKLITRTVIEKQWQYDIAGCISNESFKHIIQSEYILPKNATLGATKMDASNYYIQAGDMRAFEELLSKLKSNS